MRRPPFTRGFAMRTSRVARISRLAIILPLLALAAPACHTISQNDPDSEPTTETATLRVRNENFNDVEISIVRSGLRTRLGRVGAGRTEQFLLRPSLIGTGDISFVAALTIGSGGVSS